MAGRVDLVAESRKSLAGRGQAESHEDFDEQTPKLGVAQQEEGQRRLKLHKGRLEVISANDKDTKPPDPQKEALKKVYYETKSLLPGLLATRPDAPPTGLLYKSDDIKPLDRSKCPQLRPTKAVVLNADTIDAAILLSNQRPSTSGTICVLNMANAHSAGGGWSHGALAQEEAICYRSSLAFTLKLRFYPIPDRGGIYSPTVLIIRHGMDKGHKLADLTRPGRLHVVSAVSVAAIDTPAVGKDHNGKEIYMNSSDEDLMRAKMRTILRVAAANGRRRIVLGAFGCGVFANPRLKVADMWKEILEEQEFKGWWEDIVFAVLDPGGKNGNFEVFQRKLDGLSV